MKVSIPGSGGREHALAVKLAKSPEVDVVYVLPGNPGMDRFHDKIVPVPGIKAMDFDSIRRFVCDNDVELTVVGPEDPLVHGIVDSFLDNGLVDRGHYIFGPSRKAAMLEGSKAFAKHFMKNNMIPTSDFQVFRDYQSASDYASKRELPFYIKADGLAAGKGAMGCNTMQEADAALKRIFLDKEFGDTKVIIEDKYPDGREYSIFTITDGKDYVLLPSAQDYKRVGDGNEGPNTGGMGSVSPIPIDDNFLRKVEDNIIKRTLSGMSAMGHNYVGFNYNGLIEAYGDPYVIEYNCRMGDPETESVIPRVKSDILPIMMAAVKGRLGDYMCKNSLELDTDSVVVLSICSKGYPINPVKVKMISGLEDALEVPGIDLYFAGVAMQDGNLFTNGGRVLYVVSKAPNLVEARQNAYLAAARIDFADGTKLMRNDIALDIIALNGR